MHNANSERLSERLSTQSIRVLNRMYLERNIYIYTLNDIVSTSSYVHIYIYICTYEDVDTMSFRVLYALVQS